MRKLDGVQIFLAATCLAAALGTACSETRTGGGHDDDNNVSCEPGFIRVGGECRQVGSNNDTNNLVNNGANNGTANNGTPTNNGANNGPANNGTANNGTPTNNGAAECVTGASRCADANTVERCVDPSTDTWETTACPDGQICNRGACRAPVCTPGMILGCAGQYSQAICNETGTGTDPRDCDGGLFCRDGECTTRVCSEGETSCSGDEIQTVCSPDGTEFIEQRRCGAGSACDQGECVSLCELTRKESTYLGCDYWAVDLDNIERDGGQDRAHAIVVSNPNTDLTAEVTIRLGDQVLNLGDPMVPPGGLRIFETPIGNYIDGSGVFTRRSFHVDSTIPVTVHQFNPLNGEAVYTNDASLLLPSNALGREYIVMTWQQRASGLQSLAGYATVVAAEEGVTRVSVRPTVNVAAGPGLAGGITAGQERVIELEQGQVLSLSTEQMAQSGADLTGTEIIADKNIVVYGGHECANIPTPSTNYCDHIEQQLFPLSAWGSEYFAVPFKPRNAQQNDTWTILSGGESVLVRTIPPQPIDGVTLGRGDSISFPSNQPFKIEANGPILVGQFLHGSNYAGHSPSPSCCPAPSTWNAGRQECCYLGVCQSGTGIGDPAFTLAVPVEQYREDYIVLTPPAYEEDYLNIVAPSSATISVDGRPVSGFAPIGNTGFSFVQLSVADSVHTVTGSHPFALIAYGYDCDVSYAYPGGLNLGAIER